MAEHDASARKSLVLDEGADDVCYGDVVAPKAVGTSLENGLPGVGSTPIPPVEGEAKPTTGAGEGNAKLTDLVSKADNLNNLNSGKGKTLSDMDPVFVKVVPDKTNANGSQASLQSDFVRESANISFHNITYTVDVRQGKCCCGRTEKKFILRDLSGSCHPGLNAVLGVTGSGKSSLLDVLAGRKDKSGLTGHVLVNGTKQPENFKCMSGYVIQDDIVMGMLTVRENIEFSAALRLPSSMSREKRAERVNDVISELGLTKCADTKVGTEFLRGISGGERKRTNIAMELITSPSVLFLDEPTTGLDSNTAYSVMHLLKRLAQRGNKTIIFSIHQPRYTIYKLFDNLMLLSNGNCVYHGPATEALQYFEGDQLGYRCEPHNNPSDFFLDILNGGIRPTLPAIAADDGLDVPEVTTGKDKGELGDLIMDMEETDSDDVDVRERMLVDKYRKSEWYSKLTAELKQPMLQYEQSKVDRSLGKKVCLSYARSVPVQFAFVSSRNFRNILRNSHAFFTQVASAIILGLIVGSIYYQIDSSRKSGIQNRVGVFFFIVMNYVFGNMAAVDIFIKERALFIHENVSGYYRVSTYFFSKLLCDVVPMRAFPIAVFATVTYWMIGLRADLLCFSFYALNTLLTSLAGTAVALLFSATSRVHTIGTILTALVWTFMMVFSGLLVNVDTVPAWLRWMKWLSIFRYSMNAFLVNELKDAEFCGSHLAGNGSVPECASGNGYLLDQGIGHASGWDLWQNEVALVGLAVAFLTLAYVQLRRIKKLI